MLVNSWLKTILNNLYPPVCLLCDAPGANGRDLCAGCLADLPHNHRCCLRCALPLPITAPEGALCGRCARRPPPFECSHIPLRYTHPVDSLIGDLKFHARLVNGRLLAELLGDHLERNLSQWPQRILPVPLHPRRLRERGFNQSLELARPLGRRFGIPVEARAVMRTRFTPPQVGLKGKERQRNVRGVFALRHALNADHVAILDDVVTTGSTVAELTRLLQKAGVPRVDVWAVARTET